MKLTKTATALLCTIIPTGVSGIITGTTLALTSNQDTVTHFTCGGNRTYTPTKEAMPALNATKQEIVRKWMADVKEDPTIFYDDVHYALNQELYVPNEDLKLYTVLPQANINFKYFNLSGTDTNPTVSFEIEYYFHVQRNKNQPILGPEWAEVELTGRIDVYDLPIAITSDVMISQYKSGSEENVPFFAIPLEKMKNQPWYIHGIELGYVWQWDGTRFETAHNGWLSGWQTTYDPHDLGYFIETLPFLYDYPESLGGGKCFNISNNYLRNNIVDQ